MTENFQNMLSKFLGRTIAGDLFKKTDYEPEVCRNYHNKILPPPPPTPHTPKSLNASSADTMTVKILSSIENPTLATCKK